MKRGLTAVLAGALAAVLLVPAAGAKPGNGNGNGPPTWAGGGGGASGAATGGGKPDWAGKQHGQAKKAERQAARAGAAEDGPKHENPAWICKFEREQMGPEAFAEEYGENENKANAFGKCVSREAHDRDGVTETPAADEETPDPGDSTGEEPEEPALPAAVQAFLHYLWPLLF